MNDRKSEGAKKTAVVWVCPSCGRTAHIDRKYCVCHASLSHAAANTLAEPPEVGPCNFEVPGLCCGDCPEDCMYCASFGLPQTNGAGYGGKDCRHRMGIAKCYCCQSQITIAEKLRTLDFYAIIAEIRRERQDAEKGAAENLYSQAASIVLGQITNPVLNRIKQRELAG